MAKAGRFKAWTLQLFPTRVLKRHVEAEEMQKGESPIQGISGTRKVHVPTGNNAYERTVRYHEALHQLWSPSKFDGSQASQAVEDARLHMMKSTTKGQTRRDEVCAAYMDMWAARGTEQADSSKDFKSAYSKPASEWLSSGIGGTNSFAQKERVKRDAGMIGVIRAAGIFDRGGWRAPKSDKLFRRALQNMLDERAAQGYIDIKKALEYIRNHQPEKAKSLLKQYFLATPEEWMKHTGQTGSGTGDGEPQHRPGVPGKLMQPGYGDEVNMGSMYGKAWGKIPGGMPCEEYFNPMIKKLADPRIAKALQKGYFPNMEIMELDYSQSRKMDKGPTERTSMAGMRIKKKRLAMALSPCPPRLFVRKKKAQTGGSVLIDASGSMNLDNDHLKQIADMIPAGTVAYYSGPGFHKGYDGQLVIYAKGGRQYCGTDMPYRKGGNEVDLPALVWLLKQDKPRYFVTDRGFCFGEGRNKSDGDVATPAAHDLLSKAEAQKLVTVCHGQEHVKQLLAEQTGNSSTKRG